MVTMLKKPIFWVLLLALALRLWGITYGFPFFLVNDEMPHVYGALKMIELKTLVPAFHQEEFKKILYYPPLTSYVFLPVLLPVIGGHWLFSGMPPLAEYKITLALDPSFIWVASRIFIALVGVLNIWVAYLFARRIFESDRAGIFAALFLALSFYHIQLSHNVRHWLPAAFLLTLAWFFSVLIFRGNASWKRYFGIGTLVGAAAGGVNTAAIVGLIPAFFASIVRGNVEGKGRFEVKKLAIFFLSFAGIALLFVALHPYGFTRAEGAADPSTDIAGRLATLTEKSFSGWVGFVSEYIGALWNFETPIFLVGAFGIFLLFLRKSRFWAGTFLAYAFSFFTLLYLFDDFTARGVVFVTPIFAIFAGYAADEILKKFEIKKLEIARHTAKSPISQFLNFSISFFFFAALFGWQFITDFRYDWLLAQKDTRLVARQWIAEHVPPGSKVVMDAQYLRLTNTKEGIRRFGAIDVSALRAADMALASLPDVQYPDPAYETVNLNFIPRGARMLLSENDFFRKNGFQYLVVEYPNSDAISLDTQGLINDTNLVQRFSQWEIPREQSFDGSGKIGRLSIFELFKMKRFGPFVEVRQF